MERLTDIHRKIWKDEHPLVSRMMTELHHSKNPGMSSKPFKKLVEKLAEQMEKLNEYGILIKHEDEIDVNGYNGFTVNPEFKKCLDGHFATQDKIEYFDKESGSNTQDFGGLNRDDYIISIAVNDFCNPKPKCDECKKIMMKYDFNRPNRAIFENLMEHVKSEHRDYQEKEQKLFDQMPELIPIIKHCINQSKQKEWRSK